jgi:NOL1/NOP2/sun family putative RNA methylase
MMPQYPQPFLTRMQSMLGNEDPDFSAALGQPPKRGLRVNTLKIDPDSLMRLLPWPLEPSGICGEGFVLPEDAAAVGQHPAHLAGLFYVQDPSAMLPATILDIRPGMRVLDLCAAPGGKSGQIAALLRQTGLLVANEIVPSRAQTLTNTLERMGVRNALVTNMHPETLCGLLPQYFDAVLVDAPCSGEGMFRKDPLAGAEWSLEHVRACAARQSAILESAFCALRPGGTLVYSTCTFSREENEQVIESFLENHPALSLIQSIRLYPHTCKGEGHFAAKIIYSSPKSRPAADAAMPSAQLPKEYRDFIDETMREAPFGSPFLTSNGRILLLPEILPSAWQKLRIVRGGVLAGQIKGNRFAPAHALSMAYPSDAFRRQVPVGFA